MELWQTLLSAALVGTERQTADLALADPNLKLLLNQLNPADRERSPGDEGPAAQGDHLF
jgi:hypothetical protein